ncbi:hypothetical protein EXU85_12945 [Spirosoma sp. KCTC 42546]|uniref:hypothetical protein n=1 Tax=Spirosoma sp. KCTC 42546 TaxID=2520506 RepID=UPI0011585F0D|nr:hypothetical protein [Spirosoma sp. KCTC 42546]QDK79460.1 hypothetical protein EXU85_12945 [Spirosoma sp. KCTC 42546]
MKLVTFLLVGIGLVAMSEQAFSQDDGERKPLNNPMYSTGNYKHPNMAAAARRWETKEGVAVKKPTPGDAQVANYKSQMPTLQPVGGITVGHTPSTNLADRNYKIQRVSEPTPDKTETGYYVKKQQRKTEMTIGQ